MSGVETEKLAVRHAGGLGREVEGVKVLHIPYSAFVQHSKGFKVNAEGTGLAPLDPGSLDTRRPGRYSIHRHHIRPEKCFRNGATFIPAAFVFPGRYLVLKHSRRIWPGYETEVS